MHAENVQSAVRRLTQKPMDISPAYIPLMNIVMSVQRVHLVKNGEKKAYRRILSVNEIVDSEKFIESFKWDPIKDMQIIDIESSFLLTNFAERLGITRAQLIEETAELNLSHENWVSLIARQSYGLGGSSVGEVALFDLVKTCMRHRPDLMIVGEVRGQEAYVLFQALATGHGGMCTMHAENVQSAVRRLTQKPMDISPAYIPLMNIVMSVQRVHLVKNGEKKAYRRVLSVNEIIDSEKFVESFKWDPIKDEQMIDLEGSFLLTNFAARLGITREQLVEEMNRRTEVLRWMRKGNIRSYREVASIIAEYYARPKEFYQKIVKSEEVKPIAASR
jgi:Flp pilus assembly CpaF family ATPase